MKNPWSACATIVVAFSGEEKIQKNSLDTFYLYSNNFKPQLKFMENVFRWDWGVVWW